MALNMQDISVLSKLVDMAVPSNYPTLHYNTAQNQLTAIKTEILATNNTLPIQVKKYCNIATMSSAHHMHSLSRYRSHAQQQLQVQGSA